MTGYTPYEAIAARVTFIDLGIDVIPEPETQGLPPPPPPPIPAVYYAIAQRIRDFEHQNERVLCWLLWDIERSMKDERMWHWIDKSDPDILLGYAVHYCRRRIPALTAEEHYELERWIDFLPDEYAAAEARSDAWEAACQKRLASAKKGAETRRRNREKREAARRA